MKITHLKISEFGLYFLLSVCTFTDSYINASGVVCHCAATGTVTGINRVKKAQQINRVNSTHRRQTVPGASPSLGVTSHPRDCVLHNTTSAASGTKRSPGLQTQRGTTQRENWMDGLGSFNTVHWFNDQIVKLQIFFDLCFVRMNDI